MPRSRIAVRGPDRFGLCVWFRRAAWWLWTPSDLGRVRWGAFGSAMMLMFGGPALVSAQEAEAPTGIVNGSFETGDLTGWRVEDLQQPLFAIDVRRKADPYYWYPAEPLDGRFLLSHGFDGDGARTGRPISLEQDVTVVGDRIVFSWRRSVQNIAPFEKLFRVVLLSEDRSVELARWQILSVGRRVTLYDDGWHFSSLDTTAWQGQRAILRFEWIVPENYAGPGLIHLDSISFEDTGGCRAELRFDGVLDGGDIEVFVQAYLGLDATADFDGDGVVDLPDVFAFVERFLAGC